MFLCLVFDCLFFFCFECNTSQRKRLTNFKRHFTHTNFVIVNFVNIAMVIVVPISLVYFVFTFFYFSFARAARLSSTTTPLCNVQKPRIFKQTNMCKSRSHAHGRKLVNEAKTVYAFNEVLRPHLERIPCFRPVSSPLFFTAMDNWHTRRCQPRYLHLPRGKPA